ncbi:sensor histidine kinase [Fodinicola feengrottensis]|uniref:histidine kinase n=1 Tax=Fodinicola feengrottensis TaxID=435914 RepID=A0ABN2H041_9ACTN
MLPSVEPGQPTGADQPTETAPLVARPAGRARGSASVPSFARQETVPQIVAPPRPPSILRPPPYAPPPVPIGPGATRGTMYGTPTADGRPRRRLLERLDSWLRGNPWLSDSILAIGMLLFVAPVSLVIAVSNDGMGVESTPAVLIPILILIVLVTHGVVVVRRVMPITALIVVTVALAIKVLITPVPFPSDLIFLLVTYSVCAYGRRPAGAIAFVLGIAGGLAETARFSVLIGYRMDQDPTLILLLVFIFMFIVAAVFASWGLGQFRRVRYAYFTTLEDRAERAEAEREERAARAVVEERNRIAREMHDVVAHSLAVIVSQAQGGQYAAKTKPERAQEVLGTIAETGRQALADMRGLLGVLRSNEPLNADSAVEVNRGPQPRLAELGDLLTRVRASGLHVRQDEEGHRKQLGPTAELAVYRLVQESLTNTIKHAGPDAHATVVLHWSSEALEVTVADDGRGPTVRDPDDPTSGGHGLVGMRERLAVVGGSVHTGPRPGGGFQVRARLPYRPA